MAQWLPLPRGDQDARLRADTFLAHARKIARLDVSAQWCLGVQAVGEHHHEPAATAFLAEIRAALAR